eukprot:937335-Rhodomonas_salina.2
MENLQPLRCTHAQPNPLHVVLHASAFDSRCSSRAIPTLPRWGCRCGAATPAIFQQGKGEHVCDTGQVCGRRVGVIQQHQRQSAASSFRPQAFGCGDAVSACCSTPASRSLLNVSLRARDLLFVFSCGQKWLTSERV